jgi:hypothetical protein
MNTCTSMLRNYDRLAEIALQHVADCADPKILEWTSSSGGLARRLLDKHPYVEVTIADLDPIVVGGLAVSDLGNHPRTLVCDATAIDAPDGYFDLAVIAQEFHRLPPGTATAVLAEGTRAASKLLIIDLVRRPGPPRTRWGATASPSSSSSARVAPRHHRIPGSALTLGPRTYPSEAGLLRPRPPKRNPHST